MEDVPIRLPLQASVARNLEGFLLKMEKKAGILTS